MKLIDNLAVNCRSRITVPVLRQNRSASPPHRERLLMLQVMDAHNTIAAYFQHHGCGWGTVVTAFNLVNSYFYQADYYFFFLSVLATGFKLSLVTGTIFTGRKSLTGCLGARGLVGIPPWSGTGP